jgi:hypothetical protein
MIVLTEPKLLFASLGSTRAQLLPSVPEEVA